MNLLSSVTLATSVREEEVWKLRGNSSSCYVCRCIDTHKTLDSRKCQLGVRKLPTLICLLTLVAGCGAAPITTPTSAPSTTPTDTVSATPTVAPTTLEDTETRTKTGQTPSPTCQPNPLTAELKISFNPDVPVQVTITESGVGTLVLNRTYLENTTEVEYNEDTGVFEPATDYQVTIETDDTVRWNQTVMRNMEYNLLIQSNGSVTQPMGPAIVESPTPSC